MSKFQALYRLQTVENQIDNAKSRMETIETTLKSNAAIQERQQILAEQEKTLHQVQGLVTDMELDIQGLGEKAYQTETMLYDGSVKNPKELQERQEELASLQRRREKRQEELLAAQAQLQDAKSQHQDAVQSLAQVQAEQATLNQSITQEYEDLRARMAGWLQDRKSVLNQIDPEHHKTYKKLKSTKNGIAVARLQEDMCAVCRHEPTQARKHAVQLGRDLVLCDNCGRILVSM